MLLDIVSSYSISCQYKDILVEFKIKINVILLTTNGAQPRNARSRGIHGKRGHRHLGMLMMMPMPGMMVEKHSSVRLKVADIKGRLISELKINSTDNKQGTAGW